MQSCQDLVVVLAVSMVISVAEHVAFVCEADILELSSSYLAMNAPLDSLPGPTVIVTWAAVYSSFAVPAGAPALPWRCFRPTGTYPAAAFICNIAFSTSD